MKIELKERRIIYHLLLGALKTIKRRSFKHTFASSDRFRQAQLIWKPRFTRKHYFVRLIY